MPSFANRGLGEQCILTADTANAALDPYIPCLLLLSEKAAFKYPTETIRAGMVHFLTLDI